MTFNSEIINKILDSIFPLPERFGLVDNEEPIDFEIIQDKVFNADPAANIFFGASKMAIVSPNIGEVAIKIPFNGSFEYDYSASASESEDDLAWNPFLYAPGSKEYDYCLAEYEKYKILKNHKLNCFVAETIFYKTLYNVNIFLQELVISVAEIYENDSLPLASDNSRKTAKEWYIEGKFNINPEWIANCIDTYGESKVKNFLHYCTDIDEDILNDAHSNNYGYRKDNTPVILDYSNFLD